MSVLVNPYLASHKLEFGDPGCTVHDMSMSLEELRAVIQEIKADIEVTEKRRDNWEEQYMANSSDDHAKGLFISFQRQLAVQKEQLAELLKRETSLGDKSAAGERRRCREGSETHITEPEAKQQKVDGKFVITARMNAGSKKFIRVYNSTEFPELLLEVNCSEFARTWGRISSFLQAACVELDDISKYDLFRWSSSSDSFSHISLAETTNMEAGTYCVSPTEDRPLLKLVEKVYPPIPMSMSVSAPVSSDSYDESTGAMAINLESLTLRLMQRDCHCAVTNTFSHLFGCHILAFGWSEKDRWNDLPPEIRVAVSDLDKKIDDVQNGILLDIRIAAMFDSGEISFEYRDDVLYSVAIVPEAKAYDGIAVDQNPLKRNDGLAWWCEKTRPEPELIKFHSGNCVLSKLTGYPVVSTAQRQRE